MFTYVKDLLSADSLSAHGICLLWRPELIWTHAVSDLVIALAYFSIPVVLGVFAARRPDVTFGWVIWCFVAFIVACGTTHLMSIWTLWVPDYGIEALIKVVTALASVATAVLLWPLLPKALAMPSAAQLTAANEALLGRIRERDEALAAYRHESAERRRAEDMLRQSQKMEALGHLTGGIAHDFNNLLTAVSMNVERAMRLLPEAAPDVKRTLSNAAAAAERGARVTAQMLVFARKQPARPTAFEVADAFREIDGLLGDISGAAELVVRVDPAPMILEVDRNQFVTAILNLVVNARDAIEEEPSGRRGRIEIVVQRHATQDRGSVDIEVIDNGVGMTPEVLEHVFEPFFTTRSVGQGSGLGLSQVYGFATHWNGSVSIVSELGTGTRVRLALPTAMILETT